MNTVEIFDTDRLIAERLQERHLDDLLTMDKDPLVMNPIGGIRGEAASREYLALNLDHWDKHGHGLWILKLREDGSLVGRAGLRRIHIGGSDENVLGYALIPAFWGLGLATEIASAIVDIAFFRLGFDNLVAGALTDNMASRRVIEKVGGWYERDATYKGAPHALYRFKRGTSSSPLLT